MRKKFETEFMWPSLIAIGKSSGLSDKQISDNLVTLEKSFVELNYHSPILELLKKEGSIKIEKNKKT